MTQSPEQLNFENEKSCSPTMARDRQKCICGDAGVVVVVVVVVEEVEIFIESHENDCKGKKTRK